MVDVRVGHVLAKSCCAKNGRNGRKRNPLTKGEKPGKSQNTPFTPNTNGNRSGACTFMQNTAELALSGWQSAASVAGTRVWCHSARWVTLQPSCATYTHVTGRLVHPGMPSFFAPCNLARPRIVHEPDGRQPPRLRCAGAAWARARLRPRLRLRRTAGRGGPAPA